MELRDFRQALRKRMGLVVVLMILTGAVTYLMAQRVGPTYQSDGTVLVLPPALARTGGDVVTHGNPYLNLGGVTQARDVIVRSLTSKSVADEFGEKFPAGTTYEVVPDYTNGAPIILFSVEAADPNTSVAALKMLMRKVDARLETLQAGLDLPVEEQVSSQVLTADASPTVKHKEQVRSSILVVAVCVGAGLLLIGLLEGLAGRREREKPPAPTVRVAHTGRVGDRPRGKAS